MANDEHVALLKQGVAAWNVWRAETRYSRPNLSEANISEANLSGADLGRAKLKGTNLWHADLSGTNLWQADLIETDLRKANLVKANLREAKLNRANLSAADLSHANLSGADLREAKLNWAKISGADLSKAYLNETNCNMADFSGANLSGANLYKADLHTANCSRADLSKANLHTANCSRADLSGANLSEADLYSAILVDTDLTGANLTGCCVHGISAWRLKLEKTKQENLVVTRYDEPKITVDNIEVAQFIYLMLNNQKVRDVIDTITSKAVLILGRFTDERKAVLDALREELRKRNYLPILFDFSVPATRDITETISLLARMARFVVADITDAKSIPQELAAIVPDLPSVPVQPLLLEGNAEYGMFEHFKRYPWVLKTYEYPSPERLIASLGERVIGPAEDYARSVRE
jgi:uncharacterized protein YjbI with pentapeptide repeats